MTPYNHSVTQHCAAHGSKCWPDMTSLSSHIERHTHTLISSHYSIMWAATARCVGQKDSFVPCGRPQCAEQQLW